MFFRSHHSLIAILLTSFAVAVCNIQAVAAEPVTTAMDQQTAAAELFPQRCAAYVEVRDLSGIVDLVLEHPLRERIEKIDDIRKALNGKDMMQFRAALALIEGHIGMDWREAIEFLTTNGLEAAFDPQTNGVVLIASSADETRLQGVIEGLVKVIKLDSNSSQQLNEREYRGLSAYQYEDTVFTALGSRLMITNKKELAKEIADQFLDSDQSSFQPLSGNTRFIEARKASSSSAAGEPEAWAWLDMETARQHEKFAKGLANKPENIAVEFLLGGLQSVLKEAPWLKLELQLSQTDIKLTASTPHDPDWVPASREFFFGEQGNGVAPAMLVPKDALLNLTTYRDISKLWLAKEDLLSENEINQLAQADSTLSTIFGGLDFGQEVLGAAKPGMQIIAARQDFSKIAMPEPQVKLPAFAIVFQLNDPDSVQRRFKVAFQTMIGFVNLQLGMQEMPQLDFDTLTIGDKQQGQAKLITAAYVPDADGEEGLLNYNFSPTIGFKDDYFVVSSTVELATELVELVDSQPAENEAGLNTLVQLSGSVLTDILAENRESLISQNMLEDGHSREEAEKQIGILIELLRMVGDATLELGTESQQLNLELGLELRLEQ